MRLVHATRSIFDFGIWGLEFFGIRIVGPHFFGIGIYIFFSGTGILAFEFPGIGNLPFELPIWDYGKWIVSGTGILSF